MSMDHISKALEKNQGRTTTHTGEKHRVRDWVTPERAVSEETPKTYEPKVVFNAVDLDLAVLRENRIVDDRKQPAIFDKFRVLRTRMLMLMKSNNWTSVGITSPAPKDGKSLTATNLAFAIAKDEKRNIFLVDADLRKPSIANYFGIQPRYGVAHYLNGDATLSDIALNPSSQHNLFILPGLDTTGERSSEAELASAQKLDRLIAEIREFDEDAIIVVDLPPVHIGDDVLALAPAVDSLLLVVSEGKTEIEQLTSSVELLSEFNLLGTVLNRSSEKISQDEGYYAYYPDKSNS